jgi:hypothetical protein
LGEYFKSCEDVYRVFRAFLDKVAVDPVVGPLVSKTDLVIRIALNEPDANITIHLGDKETMRKGYFITYEMGDDKPLEQHKPPAAVLNLPTDINHRFWLGIENLGVDIINGKIKTSGDYIKAIVLLPSIKPFFRTYKEILSELGMENLIPAE